MKTPPRDNRPLIAAALQLVAAVLQILNRHWPSMWS